MPVFTALENVMLGAESDFVLDRVRARAKAEAVAKELGATHTVNSRESDLPEALMAATGGRGVDFVLDTTAIPQVLTGAAGALAIRGTLALVGAGKPGTTAPFEIGLSLIKGWTFKTIVQGSSVPQVFLPRLVELYSQGRFPIDKLIRHYKHDDINTAFQDSESGATVKPVVVY